MYINYEDLIDIIGHCLDPDCVRLRTISSRVWSLMHLTEGLYIQEIFLKRHFLRYICIRLAPVTSPQAPFTTNNSLVNTAGESQHETDEHQHLEFFFQSL